MAQTGTVLVVDHEPQIAECLIDILTDADYTAYAATNDADALIAVARHSPALLLIDVGRTGTRGNKVLEHVRALGLVAMPIVVMTTVPDDITPLLVSGAAECLAKPFDIDGLLACVARYLQPHATVPALRARVAGDVHLLAAG